MATAAIGRVEEYQEGDNIEEYLERMDCYFSANGITEKKVDVLLSVVGPKTYNVLRSMTAPAKPSEKTYDVLKE